MFLHNSLKACYFDNDGVATELCAVFEGAISADSKTFCTLLIRKMNFDLPFSTLRFSRESKRNGLTHGVMYLLSYLFMPIKAFCFPSYL